MALRKLRKLGPEQYGITLPKKDLEFAGYIDEDGDRVDEEQRVQLVNEGSVENPEWRVRPLDPRE